MGNEMRIEFRVPTMREAEWLLELLGSLHPSQDKHLFEIADAAIKPQTELKTYELDPHHDGYVGVMLWDIDVIPQIDHLEVAQEIEQLMETYPFIRAASMIISCDEWETDEFAFLGESADRRMISHVVNDILGQTGYHMAELVDGPETQQMQDFTQLLRQIRIQLRSFRESME